MDTDQEHNGINDIPYNVKGEFVRVAKLFGNFIETFKGEDGRMFLLKVQYFLQNMYQLAQQIEVTSINSEEEFPEIFDDNEFGKIINSIADRLLANRYYWMVSNPINHEDTEAGCGDLLDDLGDIYRDIKRSLLIYALDTDDHREAAMWQIKFDFDNHWGDHCANAIYASHYFLKATPGSSQR